jgi:hypothetical protein
MTLEPSDLWVEAHREDDRDEDEQQDVADLPRSASRTTTPAIVSVARAQ